MSFEKQHSMVALGIEVRVDPVFDGPGRIVRDDRDGACLSDGLAQPVGIVSRISHHHLGREPVDQRFGLRGVAALARREGESHRAADDFARSRLSLKKSHWNGSTPHD